jgi:type 1 glutamine amidotransferase
MPGHYSYGPNFPHSSTSRVCTRRKMLQWTSLGALATWGTATLWQSSVVAQQTRKKVLFFTKSAGFEHSVIKRSGDQLSHAERILMELGKQHGFEVVATKDGRVFDQPLDEWDVFVFYTTGDLTQPGNDKQPPMSVRGKQALLEAIHGGKGFVGSHCASDTFHSKGPAYQNQQDKDPYIAMLGGEFISHGKQQKARMRVVNRQFPGMEPAGEGFELFEEWYSLKNFAPDLHVLLVQETQGMEGRDYQRPPFPATWCRLHGKGRVFYTSMGHREDVWTNPIFQSILVGGIHWAGRTVDAEIPSNITEVTPDAHQLPTAG